MASSRSSTPASRGATPELLTPRSKIRALLAPLESSDEEDGAQKSSTKKISPKHSPKRQEADDDSGSDVPLRPRGKLASRMQGATVTTREPETSVTTETARDRVKKMLEHGEEEAERTLDTEMADVDEEDELPVAPRRLKRRPPREASPDATVLPPRSPSPGLFVSSPVRPSPTKTIGNQSDSENELPAVKSDRFKALVERKRQERLAREAEEEARREERRAKQEKLASELEQLDSDDGNTSSITDDEGGRQLTQQARPTRKASKKAIEEMNRETQRMARSMQLAHEAKTRKKLTKESLFERFNFKPAGASLLPPEPPANSSSRPATPRSDAEMPDKDTPPSSPPVEETEKQDTTQEHAGMDVQMGEAANENSNEDLPCLDDVLAAPPKLDKGKGKEPAIQVEVSKSAVQPKRRVRVRLPIPSTKLVQVESDDELEITATTKDKINAVFDSIPTKKSLESQSLQALRALANLRSPGKDKRRKGEHEGMTPGELQSYLHQKAKEQAKSERDRRLETLKAQGVVIQTSEERERQMQEVEDILAKAREEDKKLRQEERAAAKKEREENGEADPLAWDDSDDEEYDGANDADEEGSAIELSGSEEEYDEEEEEKDEDVVAGTALFETEADDAESETSEGGPNDEDKEVEDEDTEVLPFMKRKRARNKAAILSDDEGEVSIEATPRHPKATPIAPAPVSPAVPTSVLRSAKKTFIPGLPVQGPAGLGLTQIFAGTMDDTQKSQAGGLTQSMMPDFDHFPDSNFSAAMDDDIEDMIVDSQRDETQKRTQGVQFSLAQTQMHGLDSLLRDGLYSQMSELIEPSQDGGFQEHTPLKKRFVEPPFSTVETVAVEQQGDTIHDSPLIRRGRLRRKIDISSIEEEASIPLSGDKEETVKTSETAFSILKDSARQEKQKQLAEDFNRKKSKAKEMVEEQAEESEDEYAGLGGADGEDSDNDSAASVHDIIDDAAGNGDDERKLAAFYADRERENDEKAVEKLYKDITSGALRRKRGGDYDLSDSDDGGEARRRMKRRQFAKMQKALFADERVKKIAEDPGNQAFLRTIEDRGSDDEMGFLDIVDAPPSQTDESQSREDSPAQPEQQQKTIPDSQPRKPLGSAEENRAPAHARRTKDGKKPSNIGEVRETLSDLLDDRHGSIIPATEVGSDSEDEENTTSRSNKENQSPNSRRTRNVVVDRISLKRNASSTGSNTNRLAFSTTASSSSSFKVPALLRRATTNSSLISGSAASTSTSTTTPGSAGGFGEEAKIKKGAGKKSGVNGFARDSERNARMQENERRRQEKKVRGAESRVGLVGGLLGKGSFE